MTWLLTLIGAVAILVVLRDIFHTLWHPRGFGMVCRTLFRGVWRAAKVLGRFSGPLEVAGPLALVATAAAWTAGLVAGFALVYLPHMPGGFATAPGLDPQASSDPLASLYLSLVAVTTLGMGDITPVAPALRLVVPVQALLGFLLLTAVISWVLQLYPALARRRTLARRLDSMARHGTDRFVEVADPTIAVPLLESVREALATLEMDLLQYGESYYFRERQRELSLAATLPHVVGLVEAGGRSRAPATRHGALLLGEGLEALLQLLRREYLGDVGDAGRTLAALVADHQQPAPAST